MYDNNKIKEDKELTMEEVNVYSSNCGQVRYDCEHDCKIGPAVFISSIE